MRTIAIMNNKGGVGKTVTAINLADILVRDYRQRVILVDCDGQMNLTRFFVPDFDPETEYTMVSLLEGDGEALWSDNLLQVSKDLWLIPGSPELYTEDLEAVMEGQDQVKTRRVANFVDCARKDDGADFIIFDCPPGFTAASLAALLASDEVVIPMELDGFSVSGMITMQQQLALLRRSGLRVPKASVLINRWRATEFVSEVEAQLREMSEHVKIPVYQQVIRKSEKVPESTVTGSPLSVYSPRSAAGVDFRRWVRELWGGVGHEQV